MVLLFGQSLNAAVTFTVTPSAVSNTYAGYLTLQIGGITSGSGVVVQKYVDANSNGVVDAGDYIIQQFNLTDGKTSMVIGGTTNFNVPGDTDGATNGSITASLNFLNGDFVQRTIGQFIYVLSSTNGAFTATNFIFNVTNYPYAQGITGTVTNTAGAVMTNAIVIIFPPKTGGDNGPGNPAGSVIANGSGVYNIKLPVGTYYPLAFKSNYAGYYPASPQVVLAGGQTSTNNLSISNATSSVSGSYVDATNNSKGLPGVFMPVSTDNGVIVAGFTTSNGTFSVPVPLGASWSVGSDSGGLIAHGYVGYKNSPTNVSSGASGVTVPFYKATALVYGNVSDTLGNPLSGIAIEARDQNDGYQQDGYSDINGNYVTAALGGLGTNDQWQVSVDNNPTNYVFSQPSLGQNGGTSINVGQAIQANFTGIPATYSISGQVTTNGNPLVGVGVYASANIGSNSAYFQTANADTDNNGNYTLYVGNTNTWYVTVNYNCCTNCGNSDGLNSFGNFQEPANDAVAISNNNYSGANFAVTNCSGAQISSNALPNGTANSFYDYCCLQGTTCSGNQYWSTADPNFPPGLNLNGNGEISGTPNNSGTFNFSVTLNDSCSGTSTNQMFSITINAAIPPLQITTSGLSNATNGVYYSTNLQATGGVTPYDWSLEPGSAALPNGLTLSTNGLLSGMPSAVATNYAFIVQVTDTNGDFNSATLSLNVVGGTSPLQINTTSPLPGGTNGAFYSATLNASGGQPPYKWQLVAGSANLPANLALSTNGVISGIPNTISSNYQFIAGVTDSASNSVYKEYSLGITGNTPPPTLALVRQPGNGTIEFTFTSVNGMNYSLQSSPNLTSWTTVLDFTGGGGTETLSAPTTQGKMFYRLQTGN